MSDAAATTLNLRLADVGAVIATAAPVLIAFFADERRYEIIGVCIVLICFYVVIRLNAQRMRDQEQRVDELAVESGKCHETLLGSQQKHEKELRDTHLAYELKIGLLHATLLNLHADLIQFAGGRAVGALEFDATAGTYKYTRAPAQQLPAIPARRRADRS